jgi:DNA-binding response OmpR family regulator
MVSDDFVQLIRLLLQQSDRHPIRQLSGEDLAGYDPAVVRDFVRRGLLIRRSSLRVSGQGVVNDGDGGPSVITLLEELDVEAIDRTATALYEIDFPAISRLIRVGAKLEGPPCEAISQQIMLLGARGRKSRRQLFYLVRSLKPSRALEVLLAVTAHAVQAAGVVVLTPTPRDLPASVTRQIRDLQVLAVSDLLCARPRPFGIRLPPLPIANRSADLAVRLAIDADGRLAAFDGQELKLEHRDFPVLQLLAGEASGQRGFVGQNLIADALQEATGNESNIEQVAKSIHRIRKAFRAVDPSVDFIETKSKTGYRLVLPQPAIGLT